MTLDRFWGRKVFTPDVDVVGAAAEHVRQRVDRPRAVQGHQVGQHAPHVRRPGVLAPEVDLQDVMELSYTQDGI